MTTADFPDESKYTTEEIEGFFEGEELNSQMDDEEFVCDFCSKHVVYQSKPDAGHYMADKVLFETNSKAELVNRERKLVPLATYCEDCTFEMLLFPCEGFTEVRLLFDMDSDGVIQEAEVTDVSGVDDGIPWNPVEVAEKVTQVPNELQQVFVGNDLWGPENVVTVFLSISPKMDIRELVGWDGELDPKALGKARREYEKFRQKMNQSGFQRSEFRDHVEGNW